MEPYKPHNPLSEQQREELTQLIQAHGLEQVQDEIFAMATSRIVPEAAAKQDFTVGCSKFGGLPDVPPDWTWPKGLVFLAQFNLAELAPHDHNHLLPDHGLLSFFHSLEGGGDAMNIQHVFHFEALESLSPATVPRGYLPVQFDNTRCVYSPLRVELKAAISLPGVYPDYMLKSQGLMDNASEIQFAFENMVRTLKPPYSLHMLLGENGEAQDEAWMEYWGIPNPFIYMEREFSAEELNEYPNYFENKAAADESIQDWIVLFEMDSEDRIGAQFSDAGYVYFVIRRQDLAARHFERTYVGLWSS